MTNHAIDALSFHRALLQGARRVENKREELNSINAFPVPDRDTGNNLAYLMAQLRRQLPTPSSFTDLLTRLSEASLLGARGNSGAIFSQYFNGFCLAGLPGQEMNHLPVAGLANLLHQGYTNAYRSIQQPREGTILTAMRSLAEGFQAVAGQLGDWGEVAEAALARLKATVLDSVNVLPQQRALRAPDAGAMGFLYFAEGFLRALLCGRSGEQEETEEVPYYLQPEAPVHEQQPDLPYQFCAEVLMRLPEDGELDRAAQRRIAQMGDSMVLSQAGRLARVHLHTNAPAEVVDLLAATGTLLETKADDMHMQQSLTRRYPGQTALVVDSIADVPGESLGPHAYVLPMNLMAHGVSYQDKRTISARRVKELSGQLSSSQLNLQEVRQFMDSILRSYDRVLVLSVSARMSGLYDRYQEYMKDVPAGRMRLVDTRLNSAAEGLLALHAARRLREGADMDAVADELEACRARTHILVSLPGLDAMIASGRLNRRIGRVLRTIGYLPLVTINAKGEGTVTGLSFSRRRSERLLIKKVIAARPEEWALVFFGDQAPAQAMAAHLAKRLGKAPAYVSDISAVVANFSGEGAWAVAYVTPEEEK